MEIVFDIKYETRVVKEDIPKISKTARGAIRKAIKSKLTVDPERFGKPLRHSLKGHRTLRVGLYRVVYRVSKKTVKIFGIIHRKTSYKDVLKRIV